MCDAASGKWQVASGKWQVASGKWQAALDKVVLISFRFRVDFAIFRAALRPIAARGPLLHP
jgi:hypothetical protein